MLRDEDMLVSIAQQIRAVGDYRAHGKRGGNLGGFRQLRIAGPSITGCLGCSSMLYGR